MLYHFADSCNNTIVFSYSHAQIVLRKTTNSEGYDKLEPELSA